MRQIARDPEMPSAPTVIRWTQESDKKDFAERYTRAREVGYSLLAEEIVEISDASGRDFIQTEDGERPNHEAVARDRLRVDTRKWVLAKMLPKVYGEKVALTGNDGKDLIPPTDPMDSARKIAFLLRSAIQKDEP